LAAITKQAADSRSAKCPKSSAGLANLTLNIGPWDFGLRAIIRETRVRLKGNDVLDSTAWVLQANQMPEGPCTKVEMVPTLENTYRKLITLKAFANSSPGLRLGNPGKTHPTTRFLHAAMNCRLLCKTYGRD
jgi:hypothetical protein